MNFFKKLFGGTNENPELAQSNVKAKSRLHFVLVQDRTGMNSQEMSSFKEELVGVIEKYSERTEGDEHQHREELIFNWDDKTLQSFPTSTTECCPSSSRRNGSTICIG